MTHPDTDNVVNPWKPETRPLVIALLGKMQEELAECGAASARCQIQGIAEAEPETGKPNQQWLEEEIGDVLATTFLAASKLGLRHDVIQARFRRKVAYLSGWFSMLENKNDERPKPRPDMISG